MKIPYPAKYQVYSFWLSMPFIALTWTYILYGDRIFTDWKPWIACYAIIYPLGYVSWRMHYVYDSWCQRKLPSLNMTRKRVLLKLFVNVVVMTPSILVIIAIFHVFHVLGYTWNMQDLFYGYLVGLGVNIVFESLWEAIYIIDKYKEAAAEKEMIEQMQLRQEFDNLKQKVNPHFLFNCFNTLSSLIFENPLQAEKFLDELSKVYRYLLRNNESGLSTLEQESKFIESYSKLLETRYGSGFEMDVQIDPAYNDKHIPSLTLQLLVENAVKHNVISKQQAVLVQIRSTTDGYLSVENSLNKKTRFQGDSTGIGLANIREKYRLLNRLDVTVEETVDRFRVLIPILA